MPAHRGLNVEEKAKIAKKIKTQLENKKPSKVSASSKPIGLYFVIPETERQKLKKAKEEKAAKKASTPNPFTDPGPIPEEDFLRPPSEKDVSEAGVVDEELESETQTKRDREYKWLELLKYKTRQRDSKRINEQISIDRVEREEEIDPKESREKLKTQVSIKPLSEIVKRVYGDNRIPGLKVRDSILDNLTKEMLASKQVNFEFTPEEKEIIVAKEGVLFDDSEKHFQKLNRLISKKTKKKYSIPNSVELEDAKGITFRSQEKITGSEEEKYYKEIQQENQPTIYETQITKDKTTSKILFQEINEQTIETIVDQEFKEIVQEATNLLDSNAAIGVKVTIAEDGVKEISKELLVQAALVGGESECKEVYLSLTELSERFANEKEILGFLRTFKEAAEASGFETYIFGMPALEGEDNPHGTMITDLDSAIEILQVSGLSENEEEVVASQNHIDDWHDDEQELLRKKVDETPKTLTVEADSEQEKQTQKLTQFIKLYDILYEKEINKIDIDVKSRNKDPIYQYVFKRYVDKYKKEHKQSRTNVIFTDAELEKIYVTIKTDLFKTILQKTTILINKGDIRKIEKDVSDENLTRIQYKSQVDQAVKYYNYHDSYYTEHHPREKSIAEMQKFIYDKIEENLKAQQTSSLKLKKI